VPYPAANAQDSGAVPGAVQDAKHEDSKAALITLKNAIRRSPQNPVIHVEIARVYFHLGDAASAEHEARAACDLNGDQTDYVPVHAGSERVQGDL
jgi:Tfp pilus assembly protein PilF